MPFEIPDNWCWCRLEDLCVFLSRGKSPKYSEDKIYPVFAQKCNLKDGDISLEQSRFLDPTTLPKWGEEYKLKTGDVLVNSTGTGTVGRTRLFDEKYLGNYPFVVPDSHVSVVRTHHDIDSFFVFSVISSFVVQHYLENNLAGTTNQKELYIGVLADLFFPLPPLNEQKRISNAIISIENVVTSLDIEKEELKRTIQQAKSKILDLAIHGKLVPQDPTDEPAIELLKRINPDFVPADNSHYGQLPNGWCECRLEDFIEYEQPQAYIVEDTNYSDKYKTPVLTAGKSFIIGYTNESKGIFENVPVLIFDDFTTDSKYVDFPFKVKSSAMKILKVNPNINIKYVSYFIKITRLISDTHKRYWISEYSKLPIMIPPKIEQDRIVKQVEFIFDKLDSITAEL